MGEARASGGDCAARTSVRRYRLIVLGVKHETAQVETARDLGLGDSVDVHGRHYEVVGFAWKKDGEHLICLPARDPAVPPDAPAADEPVAKEQAWWSTRWR